MNREYNSQAFSPEEVKRGLHLKLLNTLLELNNDLDRGYNDIHIWTDGYCTIIDWCFRYYEDTGEGRFEFIDPSDVDAVEE